ncbi:MAG TPA: hypothetical protein VGK14_02720 [Novimethylophilus sp.]|jgi:hypothetical protein|uniref:hypothetical protein n=1 Tax=Novimethylophilus sp. TaxID=2137426 RepID=UPI002F429CAE
MIGNDKDTPSGQAQADENRRVHVYVREIFEEAYALALPFIDPKQGWGGQPMTRHAYSALREAYPRLAGQDLAILVPALERVFRERSKVK